MEINKTQLQKQKKRKIILIVVLALAAVLDGKAPNEKQALLELVKAGRAEPE